MCLAYDVAVSDGVLRGDEQFMMTQMGREIGQSDDFEPHYIPTEDAERFSIPALPV